ncbi:MAG: UvrD-helicase domain-containing protein [Clostridia bacterium]|nr:UvrD-helicase domain-containing protein [Clostridia bacterium]
MSNFTKLQDMAINSVSKNLLVSASAGTGKTTVMIQRIVQLILSGKITIDDILVVTFTNASAIDMKLKLLSCLESNTSDAKVREQIENIDSASISTLHSFCIEVLRTYFYVVDIDPAFTIVDPSLSEGYKDRVLDDVLKDYYVNSDSLFEYLYHIFCTNRSDKGLKSQISALHEFALCHPQFDKWYVDNKSNYKFNNDSQFCLVVNLDYTTSSNAYARAFDQYSITAKQYGADKLASYCEYLSSMYRVAEHNSLQVNLDNLAGKTRINSFTSNLKKYSPAYTVDEQTFDELVSQIESTKEDAKKNIINAYSILLDQSYDDLVNNSIKMIPVMDKLVEIERKFNDKYLEYKKSRGMLDFGDLEHLTLRVLQDNDVVRQLQSRYKYIFVDEYQDINGVQEQIISTLATNSNLFLVGDIKQSIYGFRQCDANIFADKYDKYQHQQDSQVIELTDNFRADNRILQQVNKIFSACMSNSFGQVDYQGSCQIASPKQFDSSVNPFKIIGLPVIKKTPSIPTDIYDISSQQDDQSQDRAMLEASAVISSIRQLVGMVREFEQDGEIVKRPTRYDDIAILVRKVKEDTITLYEQLEQENIPVTIALEDKYYSKECADIINLLRVIDNPLNDIALTGVALSFFGKLSKEELARVTIATEQSSVYDRYCQYTRAYNDNISDKLRVMLDLIAKYQIIDHTCSVDQLLVKLIEQTQYNLYVMTLPNGMVRANRLYTLISDAQGQAFSISVCKYLQYVELSGQQSSDSQPAQLGGVKISTIHKSKGLEYPIVIGVGLSSGFVNDNDKVITSKACGLAMSYYDQESRSIRPTLSSFAVKLSNKIKDKEEELRLLYVLTTRAKNQLILIVSNKRSQPISSPYLATSLSDWIVYGASKCKIDIGTGPTSVVAHNIQELPPQNTDSKILLNNINFVYPYVDKDIPSKVVASGLKQWAQSVNKSENEHQDEDVQSTVIVDQEQIVQQSAVINNYASIGTAYHRLCENTFFGATVQDVRNILLSLISQGVIDEDIAQSINVDYVARVFALPQLATLCKGKVYHEVPFMEKLPFNKLINGAPKGYTVLQGVIDLLAINDNSAVILDFKYTSHLDTIVKDYQLQMNAYTLATKKILNCDDVHAYIVSIKDGKVIKLT